MPADFVLWYRGPDPADVWVELAHGTAQECELDQHERQRRGFRGRFRILPRSGPAPRRRFVAPAHSVGIGRIPTDCATVGFSSERKPAQP